MAQITDTPYMVGRMILPKAEKKKRVVLVRKYKM